MFVWLNKQGVKNEEGFVFQFTGKFTAEYRLADKKATIEVEDGYLNGAPCISMSPHAFDKWDGGESIPFELKNKLISSVKAALEFQGLQLVFD